MNEYFLSLRREVTVHVAVSEQKCGAGFYRGQCVACSCNKLSDECDEQTGNCVVGEDTHTRSCDVHVVEPRTVGSTRPATAVNAVRTVTVEAPSPAEPPPPEPGGQPKARRLRRRVQAGGASERRHVSCLLGTSRT